MRLLLVWILNAIALWIVTQILPGVQVSDFVTLFVAALVLGFVNTIIKPVLILLTLPVTLLTLGLFLLVLNGLLFWAVGGVLPGFNVAGFWAGFFGALLYSIVCWAFSKLIPDERPRLREGQR
jgi:putative membrane protein